jgi:hypothetical protein
MEVIIKRISDSMEAIKKRNEDIASQLTARKELEPEERREMIRNWKLPEGRLDDEGSIHGSHHIVVQSRKNSFHKESYHKEALAQQIHGEKSHHSRSHYNRSHNDRTYHAKTKEVEVDKEVQDLKEKYAKMALLIENGEDRPIVEDLMLNTNLSSTDRVMRFPLLDKFKVP